ncbi:hypothetical protein GUJ93_ZPchr0004g39724 [Zizania palustris]|uniref:Uncharacterized protein n=1 Tax=Zizania palustris TaxID=103762 RepID=A0A8J5VG76_ZIZPA|nr:hypothetical protein GUJ93_ZPchr0004g39724 [Zizania palustris]
MSEPSGSLLSRPSQPTAPHSSLPKKSGESSPSPLVLLFLPHPLLQALVSSTGNGVAARVHAHLRPRVGCCGRAWPAAPVAGRLRVAWLRLWLRVAWPVAVPDRISDLENIC